MGPAVCELRMCNYARQVIILTDKPQKALPAAVWLDLPPVVEKTRRETETTYAPPQFVAA